MLMPKTFTVKQRWIMSMKVNCYHIKFEIGIIYEICQGHEDIRNLLIEHGGRKSDVIWKDDEPISEEEGNALNLFETDCFTMSHVY